jgi:uncharacterized DUF497 family protein
MTAEDEASPPAPLDVRFGMLIEWVQTSGVDHQSAIDYKFYFEWSEAKRLDNLAKHGVDFSDAAQIFDGPVMHKEDKRKPYGGERRFQALGTVDDDYYLVVYTHRETVCRIITAWRVDESGKKRYQKSLSC